MMAKEVLVMKEHIYSIPLTEALEKKCGCILCILEEQFEEQAAEYFLGASMMEPDAREITNEKGFCRRHLKMLFGKQNRLSLALTLETHVNELSKKVDVKKKTKLFSKETTSQLTSENIFALAGSCALCDKLNYQIESAAGNLAYLWGKNKDFKKMFEESDGLCLEHSALAVKMCENELSGKKKEQFISLIVEKEKESLSKLYKDLHGFTLSFDYRYAKNELTPEEKGSVQSAINHLTKF